MQPVLRLLPFLFLLLLPSAAAVEPEEAPALWREAYGEAYGDVVESVTIAPDAVVDGAEFRGTITFQEDFVVTDVRYQICEVGDACFAIGIPTYRDGSTWAFDTADIESETGRDAPRFNAGERIGFQYFVCLDAECDWSTQTGEWMTFPEGLSEDDPVYEEDFTVWSETHYFATTIQEGEKGTPAPGLLPALALVALAALLRRRG